MLTQHLFSGPVCCSRCFWVQKSSHPGLKLAKKSKKVKFSCLPSKRDVEQIWCEPAGDPCSGYLVMDLRFCLFRSQNRKSWRKPGGGTWRYFSHSLNRHSLNRCFSQVRVLETLMINIVQCAAACRMDAGICFLGLPPGVWDGHSVVKVWSLGSR